MTCRLGAVLAVAAVALLGPVNANAQDFPARPVRIVVPSAPGGSIDITARVIAAQLGKLWGGNVFVDNRAGAAMATGTALAARAPADGYTLLVAHNGAMSINPLTMKSINYVPERDFVPVSILTAIPMVVLVNSAVPAKTLTDLVKLARDKPDYLNHASGGLGSFLPSELLKFLADIEYTDIPFAGAAPAASATMSGTTQMMITDVASARSAIDSGRVRALAVTSSRRSKFYPELPTVVESGVSGYETSVWIGLFAPAGTPADIVKKIQSDVQKVLAMPDTLSRLEPLSIEPASGSGKELAKAMASETLKWRELVNRRNLKFN